MNDIDPFAPTETKKPTFRFLPGATNFWQRIVFHPCARPWYVYALAFFPAFFEAWVTVRVLDIEDIMRDKARDFAKSGARASRRSMHHTRKPRFRGGIPPTTKLSQKAALLALRWSQPIENLGLKLLVIGAADQFFYRFTSLVLDAPFCERPIFSGPLQRSSNDGNQSLLAGGSSVLLNIIEQNRGGWSSSAAAATVPDGNIGILFMGSYRSFAGNLPGVFLRIKTQAGIFSRTVTSEPQDLIAGVWTDFVLNADVFTGGLGFSTVTWEIVGPTVPIGIEGRNRYVAISRDR